MKLHSQQLWEPLRAQYQPQWLIVAIKEYLFVNETSFSTVMGTTRCLIRVHVTKNKFSLDCGFYDSFPT